MRKVHPEKVKARALREAENRKLYSFRFKKELVEALKKDAEKLENVTLTGLLESLIKEYLRLP